MTREWADDRGTREEIVVRCIKCGWDGAGQMVTQYGIQAWHPESCPLCKMDTEPSDGTLDDPPDEEDQDEIDTESDEEHDDEAD